MRQPLAELTNRPLLTLAEPTPYTPLHAQEGHLYATWLARGGGARVGTLMALPPGYRAQLVAELGRPEYGVGSPMRLPRRLRTPLWDRLVEVVESWPSQRASARLLAARTLLALGFNDFVRRLPPAGGVTDDDYGLRFVIAAAGPQVDAATSRPAAELLRIADEAPPSALAGCQAAFTAAYAFLVYLRDRENGSRYLDRACRRAEALAGVLPAAELERLEIRLAWLRARALGGTDPPAALRLLDGCLARLDRPEAVAAHGDYLVREQRRRLLDLASFLERERGELDAAAALARRAVATDPFDAKARLLLGELLYLRGEVDEAAGQFAAAGLLGPVGTARSWYLEAACHLEQGRAPQALVSLLRSVDTDGSSPDARAALLRAAAQTGLEPLIASWLDGLAGAGVPAASVPDDLVDSDVRSGN